MEQTPTESTLDKHYFWLIWLTINVFACLVGIGILVFGNLILGHLEPFPNTQQQGNSVFAVSLSALAALVSVIMSSFMFGRKKYPKIARILIVVNILLLMLSFLLIVLGGLS